MNVESTGAMPLTDEPLTRDECMALRKLLRASDRKKWFARELKVIVPVVITVISILWGALAWLQSHVTLHF